MENLDYSTKKWGKDPCPPINCHKKRCECGLEKVFIPSSLGDDSKDSQIAPKNGAYCNAIVVYEANGHIYIYSKEGIPTFIKTEGGNIEELIDELEQGLAQEVLDRQAADNTLQGEIDDIKNSPDVVDIVATYAALQAYDTSKLGDNDIVRVLQDEQHDGQSTYYRWDKHHSTWIYIGTVGDYYTKGQVNTLLAGKQDELTAGNNISIAQVDNDLVISATDTTYTAGTNVSISSSNVISATDTTYSNFVGTDGNTSGTAGLVPAPLTTDVGKFLKADGTWDTTGGGGPTVVQTTGTSQTDVMSQNAVTSMIFADPANATRISIGNSNAGNSAVSVGMSAYGAGEYSTAIGYQSNTYNGSGAVAIGQSARARASKAIGIGYSANSGNNGGQSSVAIGVSTQTGDEAVAIGENAGLAGEANVVSIGRGAKAWGRGSVAIGDQTVMNSTNNVRGTVSFKANSTGYGYNGTSQYRLLTGVYDGQNTNDAVNVGQVNSVIDAINTALSTNIPHIGAST